MGAEPGTPGTPEAMWAEAVERHRPPALSWSGVRWVVVLVARPADLHRTAGLLRHADRAGLDVSVVLATDADDPPPAGPPGREDRPDPADEAVRRLAPGARVRRLGLRGPGGADLEADLVEPLTRMLSDAGPGGLLSAPWRGERDLARGSCGRAAAAAAARTDTAYLEHPVDLSSEGPAPDLPWDRARVVPVDAETPRAAPDAGPAGVEVHLAAEPDHPSTDFDRVYGGTLDPWGESGWYERRKRAVTLAMLPRPRVRSALELGCSTGALTVELAERCDQLVAVDASAAAVARARARLRHRRDVVVERRRLPEEWPPGERDLVVMAEVGYFLTPAQLDRVADLIDDALTDDGVALLCHWRHPVRGWALDGPGVHRRLTQRWADRGGDRALRLLAGHDEPDFEVLLLGRDASVLPAPAAER